MKRPSPPRSHLRSLAALFAAALLASAGAASAAHDFFTGSGSSPNGPGDPGDDDGCPDGPNAGDPVMLFAGDFVEERVDVFLPGRMLDVRAAFTYRSRSDFNGPYGYGWDMSFHRRIKKLDNGDAVLLTGANRTGEFGFNGATYTNPARFQGGLVQNVDGSFVLSLPDGGSEEFDVNGNLSRKVDRNGNALLFFYTAAPQPISGRSAYFVNQTVGVVAREYLLLAITDTIGRTLNFEYGADNRLSEIEWGGRRVRYTYDASGSGDLVEVRYPATAEHPAGSTLSYGYDSQHNLVSIADGNSVEYLTNQYNAADRVIQQVFGGEVWTFAYGVDGGGAPRTTVTDPRGVVTQTTFNTLGLATRMEVFTDGIPAGEPSSYVTTYEYDANGWLIREVSPRGAASEYSYSASGKLIESRRKRIGAAPFTPSPDDLVTTFTQEPLFDFTKSTVDPRGSTITYTYDYELGEPARGNLRKITYPAIAGATIETEITYNAFGQVLSVTDPNGNVLRKTYDPTSGYLVSETSGFGTPQAATAQYTYDVFGNVLTITDPNQRTATLHYDERDRVVRVVSPLGFTAHYRFDLAGNLLQVDNAAKVNAPSQPPALGAIDTTDAWESTGYAYDSRGRVTAVRDDRGATTSYTYDALDQRTSETDPNSRTETYVYDERGLTWRIVDARATPGVTELRYDADGNLTQLIDPRNSVTTHQVDDFGRPVRMTYPDGSFEQFGFDRNGNLTSRVTPGGSAISYAYDALNRLTSKSTPSETTNYSYDPGSRLVTASDDDSTIQFAYDALDRVTSTSTTLPGLSPYVVGYTYDLGGNRTNLHYPDGFDLPSTYDVQNRLVTLGNVVRYSHDPLDQRVLRDSGRALQTSYAFDSSGRLKSMSHSSGAGRVESLAYTYDNGFQRLSHKDRFGRHDYTYDEIDQLTAVARPAGFPRPSTNYAYDLAGNRTSVSAGVGAGSYTANALNQYTSAAGATPTYDGDGNLASDGARTYTYDEENRLIGASGAFGSVSYAYDALNRRVSRTLNGVTTYFLYDRADLIHELDASGGFQARYIHGADLSELVAMDRGGQRYFYALDALNSVVALTDTLGNVVERYAYDAFGQPSIADASGAPLAASAVGNRFMFSGLEFDGETGLIHARYRDLDPRTGRFLQRDPAGYVPDFNLYRYVSNSPLAFIDPWGLSKGVGQPGFLEGMIPVWGSARAAVDDFQNGRWGWGLFNTAMALTDLIPGKSLVGAAAKGVLWKTGSHTWKATRSWLGRRGYARAGQEVHHWLIPRNQWGRRVPDWIKNQPWNLMPMPSRAWHNAIEGKGPNAFGPLGRLWHGSPAWARATGISAAGKAINGGRDTSGAGCD